MDRKKIGISAVLVVLTMLCLTYASVPLYKLFCQVTGYGGKARIFVKPSEKVGTKTIKIFFNANVDKDLPWIFRSEQPYLELKTGENKLAFFYAKNLSDKPITGMAIYNVTPDLAGKYFNKVECFCFERQTLKPNQEVNMPVLFFIDPKIENDLTIKGIKEITLSYSFYSLDS
jgi:cytochrome c oxidase assembly protein subunit 11